MVIFIVAQPNALCNKFIAALSAAKVVGWVSFLNPTTNLNSLGFAIGSTQPTSDFKKITTFPLKQIAGR